MLKHFTLSHSTIIRSVPLRQAESYLTWVEYCPNYLLCLISSFRFSMEEAITSNSMEDHSNEKVTLSVEGNRCVCSKALLFEESKYFRAMFQTELREKGNEVFDLKGIDFEALKKIVSFLSGKKLGLEQDNVRVILETANFLQIEKVEQVCVKFLKAQLSTENCVNMLMLADSMGLPELSSHSETYARFVFEDIRQMDEFLELSYQQMERLISNNELNVFSEGSVVETIKAWAAKSGQRRERKQHVMKLMKHVRHDLLENHCLGNNGNKKDAGDKTRLWSKSQGNFVKKGNLVEYYSFFEERWMSFDETDSWLGFTVSRTRDKKLHLYKRLFTLGGYIDFRKYQEYLSVEKHRMKTFQDKLPKKSKMTPESMSEAGFYYIARDATSKCFSCGILCSKEDYESSKSPLSIHLKAGFGNIDWAVSGKVCQYLAEEKEELFYEYEAYFFDDRLHYDDQKQRMDMTLAFFDKTYTKFCGRGNDSVGIFIVTGKLEDSFPKKDEKESCSNEEEISTCRISFQKRYSSHCIYYSGDAVRVKDKPPECASGRWSFTTGFTDADPGSTWEMKPKQKQ